MTPLRDYFRVSANIYQVLRKTPKSIRQHFRLRAAQVSSLICAKLRMISENSRRLADEKHL